MSAFSGLPLVIEPAELASRLNAPELILVDLSPATSYQQGHIPKALALETKRTQRADSSTPGLPPTQAALNALFSELGHHPEAVYVVYDDEGGGWAGRFIWLLDVIGHPHYHFLNGGLQAWRAEQRPLETQPNQAAHTHVEVSLQQTPTATAEYITQRLDTTGHCIWDARSPAEFSGEKTHSARGGHIPGAINLEWTALMDPAQALRIRSDAQNILNQLGITQDKEIITHCQSHRRSGFTYLVAKALGYPRVKAYAGSWSEWGNLPDTPVETSL